MANQIHVHIVAVEESIWAGDADMLVARTTEGELGVMAGHAPLLGQLGARRPPAPAPHGRDRHAAVGRTGADRRRRAEHKRSAALAQVE